MTKVCHISTVHKYNDGRILLKECSSLVKNGFDVHLIITHTNKEIINGVKIIPLKPSKNRISRLFKSFTALRKALKTKSKIYHFHDPELIIIGIILKLFGKKVIFDSHENVSKQITSKKWLGPIFIRKSVALVYRMFEKIGILFFDSVISVTPEIVNYLSPKKGVLVRNYPILSLINRAPATPKNEKFTFIYAGGLTKIRGIKEVCKAVSEIDEPIELLLLGNWQNDTFKNECLSIGKEKIKYLGSFPMEEVYTHMKSAHCGIATLYPEKNYLHSLPIKVFEYMASGLPVIMSNFNYWENIFGETGVFVDPKNVKDIKQKMTGAIKNPKVFEKKGENGKKEVLKKYSWENEAKKLIELYQKLSK